MLMEVDIPCSPLPGELEDFLLYAFVVVIEPLSDFLHCMMDEPCPHILISCTYISGFLLVKLRVAWPAAIDFPKCLANDICLGCLVPILKFFQIGLQDRCIIGVNNKTCIWALIIVN